MNSLIRGFQYDMQERRSRISPGTSRFSRPAIWTIRTSKRVSSSPKTGSRTARRELEGWAPRIRIPAVIMSERETRGIQLVGIDPSRETISFLDSVTLLGESLEDADDRRVSSAKSWRGSWKPKSAAGWCIITQGMDGRNREAGFRIAGTFDADGTGLEKLFVFTGVDALQNMVDAEVSPRCPSRSRAAGRSAGSAAARRSFQPSWTCLTGSSSNRRRRPCSSLPTAPFSSGFW